MNSRKTSLKKKRGGHPAADALDWDEAMSLIERLITDEYWRDAMLVACGCFLGLRVSDILQLRWDQVTAEDGYINVTEKKTGKERTMRINPGLREIAERCIAGSKVRFLHNYIFTGQKYGVNVPITRQRADQILKECKERYGIKSAKVFSTHTLRKTFGRRVWILQCREGRGDQALQLLCEVFGHEHIYITKRYLGIRQEEILSVYDNLI